MRRESERREGREEVCEGAYDKVYDGAYDRRYVVSFA